MSVIDLGKITLAWRGAWQAGTSYTRLDAVSWQGSSYLAKRDVASDIPPQVGEDWDLLAAGNDQLREKGDLLVHDGDTATRLPLGELGQTLQVVEDQPRWTDPCQHPSRRVAALSQVNGFGSWYTRVYLMTDGTIKACGRGDYAINGDPQCKHLYLPSRVVATDSTVRFKAVYSGGIQHYAIDLEDNVWSWGRNDRGQLGHGDTCDRWYLKRIDWFTDRDIKIAQVIPSRLNHYDYACALFLTTKGEIYGVGYNGQGALGNGNTACQYLPVRCGYLSNVQKVMLSGLPYSAYAIDAEGQLWSWGWNAYGQLGLGDTTQRTAPIQVSGMTEVIQASVSCGYRTDGKGPTGFGLALKRDGSLWSTGYNGHGELGHGDTTQRTSFTRIALDGSIRDLITGDGRYGWVAAISSDNELWAWGSNHHGKLGLGKDHGYCQRTPIKPNANFQGQVLRVKAGGGSHWEGCIVQAGNALWGAGYACGRGNIGTGSYAATNNLFKPVLGVSGAIRDYACFGHVHDWGLGVLYEDGRVDTCGTNGYGELGTQTGNLHHQSVLKNVIF